MDSKFGVYGISAALVATDVFGHKHAPHTHAGEPMIPVQVWGQQSVYAGTSSMATMTLFTPKL